jgi:hypothetical protein
MSRFCETRVMVGMYSGEALPDKQCPNCGRCKTSAHLMICPDDDRARLLIENVDELSKWLDTDSRTDPELAYWIPKYILMQEDKPFSTMGCMSPKLKPLLRARIVSVGRISPKGTSLHNFMRYTLSILQCQAATSKGQIGPNSSSQRSKKLRIHSGYTKTFCSTTNVRDTSTIRSQKS